MEMETAKTHSLSHSKCGDSFIKVFNYFIVISQPLISFYANFMLY